LFCRFNSGSPRVSGGNKPPRGPETFVPGEQLFLPPSRVVETAFRGSVRLPEEGLEWREVYEFIPRQRGE